MQIYLFVVLEFVQMKESRSELKIRKCLRRSLGSYFLVGKEAGVKIHPVLFYLFI